MSKNDGGPAFPADWHNDSDVNLSAPNGRVVHPGGIEKLQGMSLRDYASIKFAAAWVVALGVRYTMHGYSDTAMLAEATKLGVEQADHWLERKKT